MAKGVFLPKEMVRERVGGEHTVGRALVSAVPIAGKLGSQGEISFPVFRRGDPEALAEDPAEVIAV